MTCHTGLALIPKEVVAETTWYRVSLSDQTLKEQSPRRRLLILSPPSLHRMRTHPGQKQKVCNQFPSSVSQTGKLRSRSVASGDLSSGNGAQIWDSEPVLQVSHALRAVTRKGKKSQSLKAFVTKRQARAIAHLRLVPVALIL